MMQVTARHLMIHGRVQGVFFRNWTKTMADELGLNGWVRNRLNGDVEAWVEGPHRQVDQFIEMAHHGPRAAQVARIDVNHVAPTGCTTFEKRATA